MHSRQGIVGPSFITSVRRSLQNKYKEDIRIRNLIEELGAERGLKPDEAEVTKQAHDEVSARLYYTSLLDGLWQEIYEVQQTLQGLHVYDSLEREFSDVDAENEFGDSIDMSCWKMWTSMDWAALFRCGKIEQWQSVMTGR